MYCKPTQKHPRPFLLYSRGEHCSPACAVPTTPKIHPAPMAGLQCRPLQAKDSGPAQKHPHSFYYIVGASIARPRVPHPRPPNPPPHPHRTPRRPRRTHNPKIHPPHRWRACNAGPYKQKASPTPTINRKRVRRNSIAILQFHRIPNPHPQRPQKQKTPPKNQKIPKNFKKFSKFPKKHLKNGPTHSELIAKCAIICSGREKTMKFYRINRRM